MIVLADEICENLIIVLEGSVKGEMVDSSGKTIKIEDIPAPRMLAAAFLFGNQNRYPVNIVANEEVKLLYIPRDEVLRLLQLNQIMLRNFLDAISIRSQFLTNKIKFLSFKTIKGKLAQYILKLAGPGLNEVELPISQTQLAEFFGVTRPALARALGELEKLGICTVERRRIVIQDEAKLRELLKEG